MENKEEPKICSKHNIQMERFETEFGTLDEYGNPQEQIAVGYECPECKYEEGMNESSMSDQPDVVAESITKFQNSPFKKSINKPETRDFIGKYSRLISHTKSVPDYIAVASCEFLISIALYNANYTNTKGRVLSNVAFRYIADSGHNKSPLFNFLMEEVIPKAFSDYNYYIIGRGTSRGLTSTVQKEKDGRRIPIIFAKDEDSVLYKSDNYNKDMFEGYSDLFDGNIPSNTTNRHGHQTKKKCVCSYWSSGTPISIKYVDPDNFEQGWQWRHFPLIDDSPIPEDVLTDKNLPEMRKWIDGMIGELQEMAKIGAVKSTPEFMKALNEYYLAIIREKNDVERRKKEISTLSMEWVEAESKTKAPEHIIKFAMIHSASRWNEQDGTLIMDLEDFDYAMKQFEFYRSHIIRFFEEWIQQREPMELTEKMNRVIEIIRSFKERYSVKLVQAEQKGKNGEPDTPAIIYADPDPKGKYVSRSKVLWMSHLPTGSGWNSFDTVIDTLVQSEKIIQIHASANRTVRTKEGKELSAYSKPVDLFKLKEP